MFFFLQEIQFLLHLSHRMFQEQSGRFSGQYQSFQRFLPGRGSLVSVVSLAVPHFHDAGALALARNVGGDRRGLERAEAPARINHLVRRFDLR